MNLYTSIILALNICLSSSIPIADLSPKAKDPCTAVDPGCFPPNSDVGGNKSISSSTTRNSILSQFQKNPNAFVSAMSKADPDTLRQVLALLHQLLDTSNARTTYLTNTLNTKRAELGDAETDVADAQSILTSAQAALAAAESDFNAKNQVRTTKQTEKDDIQSIHDAEVDSLSDEQAMLAQVIEILEDLLGRQGVSVGVLIAETGQHQYFRVPVTGVMSSAAIAAACEAAGYKALCDGPTSCSHNGGDNCLTTPESGICGNPMDGVSQIVCNAYPRDCPEFEGLYTYMEGWNGGYGCGVENGNWCQNGASVTDKDALCVL